jgi:hypothetical protein
MRIRNLKGVTNIPYLSEVLYDAHNCTISQVGGIDQDFQSKPLIIARSAYNATINS